MKSGKFDHISLNYPVIHRRKVPFRPEIIAPKDFAERAEKIKQLDLDLDRFFLSIDDYGELIAEAYATNIHFSTRLEGNPLPLHEVQRLTRRSLREGIPEKAPDL